jgi:hypothetical protein
MLSFHLNYLLLFEPVIRIAAMPDGVVLAALKTAFSPFPEPNLIIRSSTARCPNGPNEAPRGLPIAGHGLRLEHQFPAGIPR